MPVKDTSKATWLSPILARKRETLCERVYNSLRDEGPATRKELAQRLGKPINCITQPVLVLVKAKCIIEHDKVTDPETGAKQWQLKIK